MPCGYDAGTATGNSLLPHGNARNTSNSPRQAMFLTYKTVDLYDEMCFIVRQAWLK